MARFWCGVTLPKMVPRSMASASSSWSSGKVRASTTWSAPGRPTWAAMAATVWGWSPEMTLAATPWAAK